MIRLACVYWSLLLLLVLCQHRWEAEAEGRAGAHDFVQSEKLIRNYSIGGKLKEMDTANEDLRTVKTEKVYLNLRFGGAEEEPTSNSSRANFPCPDSAAIAPCVCTVDANNNIDLDCTFVESEEQLKAVFKEEFPVKKLYRFSMTSNSAIRVLGNILTGITFERIELTPGPFALQLVSDYFLLDSRLTLSYLRIDRSNLLSGGFPFTTLADMEALESLHIIDSNFTWIPNINSPTIRDLRFTYGSVDDIEPGTFDDVTNLNTLDLYINSVTELRAGTVPIREGPMTFHGFYNHMQVVHPGAFFFPDASSAASSDQIYISLSSNQLQSLQVGTFPLRNSLVTIHLGSNQIASIEPGTFVLPEATDSFRLRLYLDVNQLTTFNEAVFGELMPFITYLQLYANPLSCGCDIAWLIASPTFMSSVDPDTTCADGTNLHDLDPRDYVDFC